MNEFNNDSVRELQERLRVLEERLGRLESRLGQSAPPPPPPSPPTTPQRVTPPPLPHRAPSVPTLSAAELAKTIRRSSEPAPAAKVAVPERSWEQKIGQKWMLIVGLVVLLLGGVFFLKFAYDQGWINPVMRVISATIAGLAIIMIGEWTLRRRLTYFAAGMFGAGIVILYYTSWAASPNGWYFPTCKMLSATQAFLAMCAVTVLGVAVAMRSNLMISAIIALLGALATPILMSSGENRQVELMSYLLLVDVGFLALALWKRWAALAPIALAGTVFLFAGWANAFADESPRFTTLAFGWSFFGLFELYVLLGRRTLRAGVAVGQSILLVTAAIMMILLAGLKLESADLLLSFFILDALVLGLCQLVRWHWPRTVMFALTVFWLFLSWVDHCGKHPAEEVHGPLLLWAQWAACFFGLFSADILARPFRKHLGGNDTLETVLALLVMGEGFLAMYLSLRNVYPNAMGGLAMAFAVFAFVVFRVLRKARNWPRLRDGYLAAALGLLLLAVPLQFDDMYVTVSYALLGIGLLVVAKWRGGALLLAAPLAAVALTVVHLGNQLDSNAFLRETAFTLGGANIRYGLLSVGGVTLAMWIMAGILSVGKSVVSRTADEIFAVLLVLVGTVFFGTRVIVELPPLGATGCWLAGAVILLIAGTALCRSWWLLVATVGLLITAAKWVLADTFIQRFHHGLCTDSMIVLNAQFLLGVALAALLLALPIVARRRGEPMPWALATALIVLAPLLIFWGGSFEVDRYVELHRASLHEPAKALHMGLSLWWAIWAGVMLIAGFVRHVPALRYTAIALFGLTVAKVLLVDMRDVEAGYRILTFLALGGLLVAASWLYHRFFRTPKQEEENTTPVE
jgi:uncharacterized membrane protein